VGSDCSKPYWREEASTTTYTNMCSCTIGPVYEGIRVRPSDIETKSRSGRHTVRRYRRFRIRSVDLWGIASYDRAVEFAGRDPQKHIAAHLEAMLAGLDRRQAELWLERNGPAIEIPTAPVEMLESPR